MQLPGFPLKSQRRSPDANQDFDCVPTCVASALQYLTGKDFEPNQVKDAVYGPSYVGGTAARAYVDYAASHGVRLFPVSGTGSNLVAAIRQQLAAGRPVIGTEPDPYAPAWRGWSHVLAFYGAEQGRLTAMDPWTGAPVTKSDSAWASLLQFNEIWVGERMSNIPAGWSDDGATLKSPNSVSVVRGFRDYILNPANNWDAGNWALAPEEARSPLEDSNPALGAGTWQPFRWTILEWTAAKGVFSMWTGQELLHARQRAQATPVTSGIPTAIVDDLKASCKTIGDTINHVLSQVEQLITQPPEKLV